MFKTKKGEQGVTDTNCVNWINQVVIKNTLIKPIMLQKITRRAVENKESNVL